jgi:hypothetical protein
VLAGAAGATTYIRPGQPHTYIDAGARIFDHDDQYVDSDAVCGLISTASYTFLRHVQSGTTLRMPRYRSMWTSS